MRAWRLAALAPVWLLAACLGDVREVPPEGSCLPGDEPFFPLAVGNFWVYDMIDRMDGNVPGCKVNVVIAVDETDEEGPIYEIEKRDTTPNTSWLLDTGSVLGWKRRTWVGGRDDRYAPYMLRLDYAKERLCAAGFEYPASYVVTQCDASDGEASTCESKTVYEHWTVKEPRQCVTATGASFTCFCVERKLDDNRVGDASEGEFCFARGVGKVEERTKQTETLVDYCVDGDRCPDPPDVAFDAPCPLPP